MVLKEIGCLGKQLDRHLGSRSGAGIQDRSFHRHQSVAGPVRTPLNASRESCEWLFRSRQPDKISTTSRRRPSFKTGAGASVARRHQLCSKVDERIVAGKLPQGRRDAHGLIVVMVLRVSPICHARCVKNSNFNHFVNGNGRMP